MKPLELYIHIPFCVKKCKYCDFLSAPATCSEREVYVRSLCQHIRSFKEMAEAYRVISIFIGGGTPSVLEAEQTKEIFVALRETFAIDKDAEITTEMNPGTVTKEKLLTYKSVGINRLSIGLQSANDLELEALGRIHTYEEFLDTYHMARDLGFENINIDLISAIPHQTPASYKDTLLKVAKLAPEHISAYSLIIEPGTPFYERYGAGEHLEELPTEEEERQMYYDTKEILGSFGYDRYEISNYSKPGYECRHNLGYWERCEYLGIGDGAASLIDNKRFVFGEEEKEVLDEKAQMEEFMFLGLRKIKGVSKTVFQETFHKSIEEVYGPVIEKLEKEQLLSLGDFISLTEKGLDVSNYVMSEFLL